jgi:hypothetical protein
MGGDFSVIFNLHSWKPHKNDDDDDDDDDMLKVH